MPAPTRQQRLASLLHREIATAVRGLDDPRLGLTTITRVEMTGDLQLVTAYWTVLGAMRERRLAEHALESARTHIRAACAPAVRTRLVPDLRFLYDDREEKRERMSDVIGRARRTDSDHGQRPEPSIDDPDQPGAPSPASPDRPAAP
jgi:ribosome-binding factor A